MYFGYHYPEWNTYRPHSTVWTDSKKLDTWDERIQLVSSILHRLCTSALAVTEHSASLYGTLTVSTGFSAWCRFSWLFLSCYCSWILKSLKTDTVDWNLFVMEYFWRLFCKRSKWQKYDRKNFQWLHSDYSCDEFSQQIFSGKIIPVYSNLWQQRPSLLHDSY